MVASKTIDILTASANDNDSLLRHDGNRVCMRINDGTNRRRLSSLGISKTSRALLCGEWRPSRRRVSIGDLGCRGSSGKILNVRFGFVETELRVRYNKVFMSNF